MMSQKHPVPTCSLCASTSIHRENCELNRTHPAEHSAAKVLETFEISVDVFSADVEAVRTVPSNFLGYIATAVD